MSNYNDMYYLTPKQYLKLNSQQMKTFSNTEAELKESFAYKKTQIAYYVIRLSQALK